MTLRISRICANPSNLNTLSGGKQIEYVLTDRIFQKNPVLIATHFANVLDYQD